MSPTFETEERSDETQEDSKRRGGYENSSLRCVTIKQLLEASQPFADGAIKLDGHDLHQVCIVARLHSINQLSTNIFYILDDGTRQVEARKFISEDVVSEEYDEIQYHFVDSLE